MPACRNQHLSVVWQEHGYNPAPSEASCIDSKAGTKVKTSMDVESIHAELVTACTPHNHTETWPGMPAKDGQLDVTLHLHSMCHRSMAATSEFPAMGRVDGILGMAVGCLVMPADWGSTVPISPSWVDSVCKG